MSERSAVIPMDNPTVPKAEITSNNIFKNGSGSVIFKRNTAKKINNKLIVEIARDRTITLSFMALFPIVIWLFPFKKVNTEKTITKNVVSLIPPPVEALPAPTN